MKKNKSKKRKFRKDGYKRIVDNKMRSFGYIDFEKKIIRVNKKKNQKESFGRKTYKRGELTRTILHEEIHRLHPKMWEKNVEKEAKKRFANMSTKQKAELRKWFN